MRWFATIREPKESILRRFDVTVMSLYFPEFEREMPRYLSKMRAPETPPLSDSGGVRMSATAIFRRYPDGANRARDSVKPGEVANDQG